jgi:hypothetical protein
MNLPADPDRRAVSGSAAEQRSPRPIRDVRTGRDRITGTVTGVFGNKFVLEDDNGKVLVEGGPDGQRKLDIQRRSCQ